MDTQSKIDKDLKEIIQIISQAVKTGMATLKDGFQLTDLAQLIPVLMGIPEAIKDADNAWHYIKEMTEEKEAAIVDAVAAELNDTSDNVKTAARRILRLLAEGYMTADFFANMPKPEAGS